MKTLELDRSAIYGGRLVRGVTDWLLFRGLQPPVPMWIGAGLSGAELTFLSRLSATSGATHRQGWFLLGYHGSILQG